MSNSFSISVATDPEQMLAHARQKIEQGGGSLQGDSRQGNFSGKSLLGAIQGEYQFAGNELKVKITEKPALVPIAKVKAGIEAFFTG
ncbi:MAG: hypothetical protein HQL48_06765 [Gammaproteobacteria bacterium]|nr:hypothetical protein [Gammaproteobacteria bacterium]